MSRWHQPSCPGPNVYVQGEQPLPRCHNCDGSPELVLQSLAQGELNAIPPIPPDEPPGNLNLRWPPSVPYVRSRRGMPTLSREAPMNEQSAVAPGSSTTVRTDTGETQGLPPATNSTSRLYGPTLSRERFRLACISAASTASMPVHLSLEAYPHDNCPEYETVSYTWGGEERDSTL